MNHCLPLTIYGYCKKSKQEIRRLVLVTACIFLTSFLFAQTVFTGKVTLGDSTAQGASVQVKGKNTATQTDAAGNFSIRADIGDVLVVSFVGYNTQEAKITNTNNL